MAPRQTGSLFSVAHGWSVRECCACRAERMDPWHVLLFAAGRTHPARLAVDLGRAATAALHWRVTVLVGAALRLTRDECDVPAQGKYSLSKTIDTLCSTSEQ